MTLKVGLDVHGVIDTFPEIFRELSRILITNGHEVHVVTGLKKDGHIEEELAKAGIHYTHYFSIVDQLEHDGVDIDWIDGLPWAPDEEWNIAKRNYCDRVGMTVMIDDSYVYRDTFDDADTVFLHLINPERKTFKTREDNTIKELVELPSFGDLQDALDKNGDERKITVRSSSVRDLLAMVEEQKKFINQVKGIKE